MARPIRIEYPGAFYHVFSRGNQKQLIFFSDEDRCEFLSCLRDANRKFGAIVHTYGLMPNHYHLFLETPLANLSRIMHLLMANYTSYINKKHDRHGHLFQGRFRSVLVEAATYAKELSRYIHLNPVRSGLVERPEQYRWSSYGYFRGEADPGQWLDISVVLRLFGEQVEHARRAYSLFVEEGMGEDIAAKIKDSIKLGILGSDAFIDRIKRTYLSEDLNKPGRDRPQLRRIQAKPDLERIRSACETALGSSNRWAIPVAIFLCHRCTSAKLREIGEFFSLGVSGVSNACSRTRDTIDKNDPLARAVQEIEMKIRE